MRYKLLLCYQGTNYHGWQLQANAPKKTIQGLLEEALERLLGQPIRIHGSGRTDAGVHALGQVAHCDLPSPLNLSDLRQSLNAVLPRDIRILAADAVSSSFHARFSAKAKTYTYHFWPERGFIPPWKAPFVWACGNLDLLAIEEALPFFLGEQDFASLQNAGTDVESSVRTILAINVKPLPLPPFLPPHRPEMLLTITATGFLKQMVRNIAGLLVQVGLHRLAPIDVLTILRKHKRKENPAPTAPPLGLFLAHVDYEEEQGCSEDV